MKQYFIGIDKRSKNVIIELFNYGASLMFNHHPIILELNKKFNFYDGEWMLLTDVSTDDSHINTIRDFLESCDDLKYEIIFYKELKFEETGNK